MAPGIAFYICDNYKESKINGQFDEARVHKGLEVCRNFGYHLSLQYRFAVKTHGSHIYSWYDAKNYDLYMKVCVCHRDHL